jgi:hypothetical protein
VDIKKLRELVDDLFSKKLSLNTLHQEIAENFYVERADFTVTRTLGTDFAADLQSSFPLTCRRELGDQFGTMLRPTAKPWFHLGRRYTKKDGEDSEIKGWTQWMAETQRRAMYDRKALFTDATKLGDHDFAAFGQTVLSIELNKLANGLLFRNWHQRDVVWQDDEEGGQCLVARKWKPPAYQLKRLYGDKVHKKVKDLVDGGNPRPFEEIDCLHIVVDADMYDGDAVGRPRWSIYYDCANQHIIEEVPIWNRHYVIPRWMRYGTQYAYSPAVVCALPDARLLQAMTFTLLEAGEKAANPPIVATENVVKSDLALYAGGTTWISEDYDERLGEAMRPLTQDFRGLTYGVQMNQDTRAMLHRAFYLDALTPFARGNKEETAYEVGQRVQKYVRDALPIFEPMEQQYNAQLCDETFEVILRAGGFGSPMNWPRKLQGAEMEFTFESPLHDLIEQQKGRVFQESISLVGNAIALDPSAAALPKVEVMLRDALNGIGAPASWMNNDADVQAAKDSMKAQQAATQKLASIEQASKAAKNIGQSGMVPQVPA